ncbi:TPA: transposase, partial [Escherichia coli]
MNTSYKHLSIDEREKIMVLLSLGKSIGMIAKRLCRAKSTICREIKRNGCDSNYSATKANCLYQTRRQACHPRLKLNDPLVFNLVQDKLFNHQWSPEQIQHRLAYEGNQIQISYATIYRGLYKGLFDVDGKLATRKLR